MRTASEIRRPYGVRCSKCGHIIVVDYEWVGGGTPQADLRRKVEAKGGLGGYAVCEWIDAAGGRCGSANLVMKNRLLFADDAIH